MELTEAILGRRSIRRFTEESVPFDQLVELVRAGTWAPTAGSVQSWRFVIVDDSRMVRQLKAVSPGMLGTPTAVIAICQDKEIAFKRGSVLGRDVGSVMDAAMAGQNIMLAAHANKLGSCAILSFHERSVRRFLDLPENVHPELLIAIGVPDIEPIPPRRVESGVIFRNSLRIGVTVGEGQPGVVHDGPLSEGQGESHE